MVTVFPSVTGRPAPYQILNNTYKLANPAINCTLTINGNQITYTGTRLLASS